MDLYHSLLYQYVLNAKWFVWSIIVTSLLLNFIAPILVWFVMNSKPLPMIHKWKKREKKQ